MWYNMRVHWTWEKLSNFPFLSWSVVEWFWNNIVNALRTICWNNIFIFFLTLHGAPCYASLLCWRWRTMYSAHALFLSPSALTVRITERFTIRYASDITHCSVRIWSKMAAPSSANEDDVIAQVVDHWVSAFELGLPLSVVPAVDG